MATELGLACSGRSGPLVIIVRTPPKVVLDRHGGWEMVLWAGEAFDAIDAAPGTALIGTRTVLGSTQQMQVFPDT